MFKFAFITVVRCAGTNLDRIASTQGAVDAIFRGVAILKEKTVVDGKRLCCRLAGHRTIREHGGCRMILTSVSVVTPAAGSTTSTLEVDLFKSASIICDLITMEDEIFLDAAHALDKLICEGALLYHAALIRT